MKRKGWKLLSSVVGEPCSPDEYTPWNIVGCNKKEFPLISLIVETEQPVERNVEIYENEEEWEEACASGKSDMRVGMEDSLSDSSGDGGIYSRMVDDDHE